MKRAFVFALTLVLFCMALPATVIALTPEHYAVQVLKKDLPQALAWLKRLAEASSLTQPEAYSFYQSALPEVQENHHQGISVKGSLERMLLLLEGARYFPQAAQAPIEFLDKKEHILKILQIAKDHLDRMQIGEDPQVLLEEWAASTSGNNLGAKFETELLAVFIEMPRLLSQAPAAVAAEEIPEGSGEVVFSEASGSAEIALTDETQVLTESTTKPESQAEVQVVVTKSEQSLQDQSFEEQRFSSYVQMAEAATISGECSGATLWKTDRAESCQSDDSIECDRNYARQCKKLQ